MQKAMQNQECYQKTIFSEVYWQHQLLSLVSFPIRSRPGISTQLLVVHRKAPFLCWDQENSSHLAVVVWRDNTTVCHKVEWGLNTIILPDANFSATRLPLWNALCRLAHAFHHVCGPVQDSAPSDVIHHFASRLWAPAFAHWHLWL